MKTILEKNKEYSENYHQKIDKKGLIPEMIKDIINKEEINTIVDLGCGDGEVIRGILNKYQDKNVLGIDISPRRINDLIKEFPKQKFICADVCNSKLDDNSIDLAISTQLIEHLEDDVDFVGEIERILKPKGYAFITSVIKKPWAIYKYRNKGKFVLDPTYVREYKNVDEFLELFKPEFKLIKYKVFPVKRKAFGLSLRIPGYYIVEALWEKI